MKRGDDFKFFFDGEFLQLRQLSFNAQHLSFFLVGGFASVQKVLGHTIVVIILLEKFAFGVPLGQGKKIEFLAKRGWRIVAEIGPLSMLFSEYEKIRTDLME